MKPMDPRLMAVVCALLGGLVPRGEAETTLDALEQSLKKARTQHEEGSKSLQDGFRLGLDRAVADPGAAAAFFVACGGTFPDPPRELFQGLRPDRDKKERQEIQERFRKDLELNCLEYAELVRFAYQFATGKSKAAGDPGWGVWLDKRIREYAGLRSAFLAGVTVEEGPLVRSHRQGHWFRDRPEGSWKLQSVPELYKQFVVDRRVEEKNPAAAEASWDLYIAAMRVRIHGPERWTSVEEPRLLFQKYQSLFGIAQSETTLARMVGILQNHPQHPDFAAMQKTAEACLEQLKAAR